MICLHYLLNATFEIQMPLLAAVYILFENIQNMGFRNVLLLRVKGLDFICKNEG